MSENAASRAELAAMGITEASVAAMIATDRCAWVAVADEAIIGFSMIDAEEGALFAAFVLPGHEGLGVGRRLVAEAEAQLFARHAVIWLETAQASRAAGFYRHLGWGNAQEIGGGDIRLEKRRP
ncbi:GNAT family N-acetyltransferase [Paenirhodobacter sp.]|uniref:GNAT family N-acetyltransferase n=1 Tax=Paenirhodobacter sp. TaxID=1965326 RepID=UPI003B3D29EA